MEALESRLLLSGPAAGATLLEAGLLGPAAAASQVERAPDRGSPGDTVRSAGDPAPPSAVSAQVLGARGGYASIGDRRMLFVPGLELLVLGTGGDDTLTISQTSTSITLTTPQGSTAFAGSFPWVTVYGFGGHDTIRLASSVTASATVYCGDGGSTVYDTGSGRDTVYGGAGADTIISFGGGAPHRVFGGDGVDSFWVDGGTDLPDASAAEQAGGYVHQVQQFYGGVSMAVNGQSLADPAASGSYVNYASDPLFTDGPTYTDVRQGAAGDCYFLATLAAIADANPNAIRQMITSLGDGTYAVRYYSSGAPVYLRVDADLPANGGSLVYAKFSASGEMWVALTEKAYAFFRTGAASYASLDSGWMSVPLSQITDLGPKTSYCGIADAAMYAWISDALSRGLPVTAGSADTASGPIVSNHSYEVKSAFVDSSGQMFVTLYNPWGYDGGTPLDSDPGDGLVTLTVTQFQQLFIAAVTLL